MRERFYKGRLIIDIDSNGDNFSSFEKEVEVIRRLPLFKEEKYSLGFFDEATLWGNCDGIDFKLEFSGFLGTELIVDENLKESELIKIRQLAKKIYSYIHNL